MHINESNPRLLSVLQVSVPLDPNPTNLPAFYSLFVIILLSMSDVDVRLKH
jgi:hypothetical protein